MEQIILNILEALRHGENVDDKALVKLIHAEARREGADKRDLAKRRLLPFYQRVKREEPARWAAWNVDSDLERQLLQVLRMKPRRTASGVATITVITKPWPCSGDCLFCPNDLRMPKSYLHAEPACARAEQNCFDPYLQVSARLTALTQMGHATDKIELIVLGGTYDASKDACLGGDTIDATAITPASANSRARCPTRRMFSARSPGENPRSSMSFTLPFRKMKHCDWRQGWSRGRSIRWRKPC